MKKRMMAITLALALLVALCACSKEQAPAQTPAPTSTPAEEDVVICKVNAGELYRSDYLPLFYMQYNYYAQNGVNVADEAVLKQLQEIVFEYLLQGEVLYQKAVETGITVPPEEEQAMREEAKSEYDYYLQMYISVSGAEDPEEAKRIGLDMFAADLKQQGLTPETYEERLFTEKYKAYFTNALYENTIAGVVFDPAKAQAYFEEDVKTAQKQYAENTALYEAAQSNYESAGGLRPLFIPEGFVRVKHILVAEEETALALIARINAGEDFDALMAEYGTDPGMKREPTMTSGYLVGPATQFVESFKKASFALKNVGDITDPVQSSHGFHVIKLIEKVESRALTYEEVKEEYIQAKPQSMQTEYYTQCVQAWIEEADIVSYIGRIRDLGKGA